MKLPRKPQNPPVCHQCASRVGFSHSSSVLGFILSGVQGVPGAYSEAAVLKAYPNCDPVPCETFDTTFLVPSSPSPRSAGVLIPPATCQALELWIADRAVLPIENSLGGSIHRNFDLMLQHRLHIVGEVQMVINHCLMALPGTTLEDLKQVHSHPQVGGRGWVWFGPLGFRRFWRFLEVLEVFRVLRGWRFWGFGVLGF